MQEAIKSISARIKAKRISADGRDCTTCKVFKRWTCYAIEKNGYNGRTGECLDCRNEKKKAIRQRKEIRDQEAKYKRDMRNTEKGKIKQKLDNLYYQDPQVIRNREIIKSFRNIDSKESVKSKCEWLHNCGYSVELLEEVYGKSISQNKTVAETRY